MSGEPQVSTPPPAGRGARLRAVLRSDVQRLTTTGVPHLFAAVLLTQGISTLRRILLVRILSLAEQGQMAYVMQIADFLALVADLGITTATLKYAAEPVSTERKREWYCAGLQWGTLSATVGALLYMAVALMFPLHAEATVRLFLLLIVPYIPLAAIAKIPIVFMQAQKDIKRAARFTAITQVLTLVLLVGATYFFHLWGFFITVTAAPLSNLAILVVATRRDLRWFALSWKLAKRLISFGSFSLLANMAGMAAITASTVMLRWLTGSDAEVGLFAIGLMIMSTTRLLPATLMQTAFPYLSGILLDPQRLRARVWELAVKQALVMAGVAVLWLLVGRYAIVLLLGAKCADSFWSSVVLVLGGIPFAFSAAAAQAMLVLDRVRVNFCAGLILLVGTVAGM